jgi:hypothetical protein
MYNRFDELIEVNHWTRDEALEMYRNSYRKKILSQFNLSSFTEFIPNEKWVKEEKTSIKSKEGKYSYMVSSKTYKAGEFPKDFDFSKIFKNKQ